MSSYEQVCEVFFGTIEPDMLLVSDGRMGEVIFDTVELVGMLVRVILAGISWLGLSIGALVDSSKVGERAVDGVTKEVVVGSLGSLVGVSIVCKVALLLAAVAEVELLVMYSEKKRW